MKGDNYIWASLSAELGLGLLDLKMNWSTLKLIVIKFFICLRVVKTSKRKPSTFTFDNKISIGVLILSNINWLSVEETGARFLYGT